MHRSSSPAHFAAGRRRRGPSRLVFGAALIAVALVNVLFAAPRACAQPQQHARATLYARADGDDVKVAIQIQIDPGWHIYHGPTATDMGPPEAVGTPTVVTLIGEGFTWSAPRFPVPIREEQDFGATKTFIFEHVGTPVIWLRGKKGEGADLLKLEARIDGLTCDVGGCIPYRETVAVTGPGTEKFWKKFPADLTVTPTEAQEGEGKEGEKKAGDPKAAVPAAKRVQARLYVRADGDDVKVAVELTIAAGWHVFHGPTKADLGPGAEFGIPTTITFAGADVRFGAPRFPEPEKVEIDFTTPKTWIREHFGAPVIWFRGKAASGADLSKLTAKVGGQVCDANVCDLLDEVATHEGAGPDALFAKFPADLTAEAAPPAGGNSLATLPLWKFLGLAVFWAIFSLLMPCTYPMIPITISYFTKQAAQRQSSGLPLSLCYGAGIVLSYVLIGLIIGPPITVFAANPWTNLVIGLLFVVFALSLLGLFILQPPQFLLGAATAATRQGGYLGVFLMGATLCVTSFTCTAPFVGNLLAVGANGGDRFRVILGMGTFGVVMAVPFVFLSLLPAKAKSLPRSGEWLHVLKVTLGFVELAAAVKFLSNSDLVWKWDVLSRELVLILWAGFLFAAALYVWGAITLKEDVELRGEATHGIGAGRLVCGLVFFLFAFYFVLGAFGAKLDTTTEVLVPTYSKPFGVGSTGGPGGAGRSLVARGGGGAGQTNKVPPSAIANDYATALAKAKAEHKRLAINFTGNS